MSKRYQNYPAAPTILVSAVSASTQLTNISDMRLCKDNSVVLEVYVGESAPRLLDTHLLDLAEYFQVPEGSVCVEPGDDPDHLFIEVWATSFDFSEFFPEQEERQDVDPDFISEHVVLVEGAPFSVLVHYDYFFNRYVAEVLDIPGGEIIVAAEDLESALSTAAEQIDTQMAGDAERIEELSANLFDPEDASCFCDEFPCIHDEER